MRCTICSGAMSKVHTTSAVELDRCDGCGAVWFDRGELFLFWRDRAGLQASIERARGAQVASTRRSPRSGGATLLCTLVEGGEAYLEPEGGGLLVPRETLRSLAERRELDLRFIEENQDRRVVPIPKLPNLALRSFGTLVGLFGLLSLLLIAVSLDGGLAPSSALLIVAAMVTFQFLVSPIVTDWFLRWASSLRFVELAELPPHLQAFVTTVCDKYKMGVPRFGLITDQSPNAFTYGHTRHNARLVLTEGLFELLTPEELEAVVGHELGHVHHWDMAIMTFAQLVPMVAYWLYRAAVSRTTKNSKDSVGPAVAAGAYLIYIVSEYVVLWLSRTREFYADRFSGEATRCPAALARALTKIAYGLAGRNAAADGQRPVALGSALGIFDAKGAQALALASCQGAQPAGATAGAGYTLDTSTLKGAMKWDLWNPWARWFELNSTHPLTARRLLMLSGQSEEYQQEPFVRFDLPQPESLWDEFLVDLLVMALPMLTILGTIGLAGIHPSLLGPGIVAVALAMALKLWLTYPTGTFPEMSVQTLLSEIKVSGIRPVPCRVEGTIRGKGVPGLIWSDDFVMQDDTGIVLIDHRQPLALWEALWGWLRGDRLVGNKVLVEGWYRRSPLPFVEIKCFTVDGVRRNSYLRHFRWATALVVLAVGLCFTLG